MAQYLPCRFRLARAFAGDMVCVTPEVRTLGRDENTNARRTRVMG